MKLHNIASRCLCLLTGVALLTACDNETDFADPNNRDGKPLRIETSIAETRAVVTGTNFAEGDRVGLFVLDDGGQYYADNAMNQPATYNASGWSMENEIVLSKEKTPYVFAVYPYYGSADYIPVDINMRMSINIAPNQYEGIEGQADWMYANALPLEGNTAKLTFRHALARVTLQLKSIDQQGDGFLSLVRMQNATKYNASTNEEMGKGKKLQTYGIMSLSDGTIETYGEEDANLELATELVLSEDALSIDILVIPTAPNGQLCTPEEGTTGGGIEVLLTIDGKQYRVDLGVPTWHAGQQYIYPITINRNSAEVTPELTPTEGEYVDLGLPSGTLWASCNVGANSPEEYGKFYAWGETETKEEYTMENYKYYNTETGEYISIGENIAGTKYDAASVNLGNNWRMPTDVQFQELIDHCSFIKNCNYKGQNGTFIIGPNKNTLFFPERFMYYDYSSATAKPDFAQYGTVYNLFIDIRWDGAAEPKLGSVDCYYGNIIRPIYDPQPTKEAGEAVDLGLSVKWASFNVGATKPEEAGGYYAWGETEEKEEYSWEKYNWCKGTETSIFKYCTNSSYGTVDNKTTLDLEDDVAHVKWGGTWRMPTQEEIQELVEKCTWTWTEQNGVSGQLVTSSNGNSIFLPAAGHRGGTGFYERGSLGYYWSATLYGYGSFHAYNLYFGSGDGGYWDYWVDRSYGHAVRPVTE